MTVVWQREECRRCRDEKGEHVAAAGIVWGKLCDPEWLGPRCADCIREQVGHYAEQSVRLRDQQWAIYPMPIEREASA